VKRNPLVQRRRAKSLEPSLEPCLQVRLDRFVSDRVEVLRSDAEEEPHSTADLVVGVTVRDTLGLLEQANDVAGKQLRIKVRKPFQAFVVCLIRAMEVGVSAGKAVLHPLIKGWRERLIHHA
jgi:hypothetical protein